MDRKNDILLSARRRFAEQGFCGTSLREIAADAQVSLTLLDHYFGSKAQLFTAVFDACSQALITRARDLRQLIRKGPGAYTLEQLIDAWITPEFEIATREDGESQLRFLARVESDPAPEVADAAEQLESAAQAFIDALQACFPSAGRRAAANAWLLASGASARFLLSTDRLLRSLNLAQDDAGGHRAKSLLLRSLTAGVQAAMQPA